MTDDPDIDNTPQPADDSGHDTMIDDDAAEFGDDTEALGDTPDPAASTQPPPPLGPPAGVPHAPRPAQPGLVRDPYSRLGGVASGIAHRYGWSVAGVRLAFVAALLVSCGTAVLLYLAAWVIVPRATVWPPDAVRRPGEQLSGRDLGIGVAVLGVIALLLVGTGNAAAVLVPLVLVGGGIWLLVQDQREPLPSPTGSPVPPPMGEQVPAFATQPAPVGQPVPPRSRGRKWFLRSLVAGFVALLVAAIAVPIALIAFVAVSDPDSLTLEFGEVYIGTESPNTLDDLPRSIESGNGAINLDLTDIPRSEFEALTEPVRLDVDLGDGIVRLDIPEWLDYSLDARVGDGDVDIDEANLPAATVSSNSVVVENDDPDIVIVVRVDDGGIDIDTSS